ncbi:MAG: cell division protein FtsQ/DivIB [Luteolibacter sp.]
MSKRPTRKVSRHPRSQVLEVRVMSPRIAWLRFLGVLGGLTKYALVLAAVTGIGWGVWQGIQRAFYKNPDFQLKILDLNANPVIDEAGLAEMIGISPPPSLFDIDAAALAAKLKAMPGIAEARTERHLPGTLMVRVVARTPKAWIACPEAGLSDTRRSGGMLVDQTGVAYPCPELQLETAENLPMIQLSPSDEFPITAGQMIRHPEFVHCCRLLDSAAAADPDSLQWIDSVSQVNAWSLMLVTRQGTSSTFGLGDHERQIHSLRMAMDHSNQKGYAIATINLIPKHNIPITLRTESPAPRAIPVAEPSPEEVREDRRTRDLKILLNSN